KIRIKKEATAGLDDKGDVIVRLLPGEPGSGIDLNIESTVKSMFEKQIRASVLQVLTSYNLTDLKVSIEDKGALDYVIRARVTTAVERALNPTMESIGNRETSVAKKEKLRRSRIYIPGNRPRMLQKGPLFGADAVILDLEDSVPPEEKDAARLLVKKAIENLDFGETEIMVRINPLDVCGEEDLEVVLPAGPDSIVLPKCEKAEDVKKVEKIIERIKPPKEVALLPLIETAKGLLNAYEIALASPLVDAITFGGEDFTRDIGATRTKEGKEILFARSMLVMAAKAAGVQALDTVFSDVKDEEGLRKDTEQIKTMGFDGKAAIHPAQIEVIHQVFTPTEEEIRYAVKVLKAAEEAVKKGSGVAVLKGKMIDVPVIKRAERVVRIAKLIGLDIAEMRGI
ncbi:MAG TPA: citrate lyase acyl carrier protein, partial [Thermoplasmata archaeon]|nr:citrate lyase acyl carrier protein [Thermoplasmata archaeon]